ncbi:MULTISPECIES: 2-oxoglutarate dehydrogenase complex dihydrolipoyllysine-residue succinyltransferase [Brucella/Ochrobactrum group]|uniref:Dihydrolipoyllysine-residue succinyltransferase component of 2-oxoglutarate dehydrogenase complex n=1 Tax=Brucella anthropi (strain ATCC 49188 / DSM 6882 / CCUG 24695 / JCM 21032 / LMG 3331 / NBRC 15819 / NCTC 12168 / Alc 37) TaxID=439375 RepID=A6WXF1_BRUA4|nr:MULTISPECIES: 2-oxoglutarate dehydrogenase complex dihydrolipoyllysine-residue succinyltransferase [Brucella/Ochrobactrum group]MCR5939897.1 2-oxoglutarate dehydrogenase complex dihydrolipoyllysine-residue succinyltransferase [Ochrobactrum sp. XJ1]QOD63374.1 2-oxoglutarate dehydrogenase complex dihydrolipoyllysine-residue succinyltransferase [Ochrobactrum sp. MT180101]ABS13655.1 2-oxoglutarate dehydrogenase, E2 subunit, dihydrolipoamide succinyltransferase [Brucella anthropi ATCC 49188]AIK43
MATEIRVPTLGESVTEATIGKWFKKVGDAIAIDEPLVELETDKVTVEVPAAAAGVLAEITAKEGDTVEVNALLGQISTDGAAVAAAPAAKKEEAKPAAAPAAAPVASASSGPAMQPAPAASKLLAENNLSADQVDGSGKRGQVLKGDVLDAIAKGVSAAPAPAAPAAARPASSADDASREERVKMTRLRQTIAKRLKDAQNTAAMLTTYNEVDMSAVMELRTKYKDVFEKKHGVKLGFMGFFTKAVTHALKEIPAVNAEIDGTDIIYKNFAHVGMAVGTDKGLVVPVIRDADQLSIAGVEKELGRLAKAARDGTLSVADMQGGTFTITNGGVYGSLMSSPILNAPQSGILGMHKIQERPVVVGGQIVIRPMMYLALSYDHRIVDGKEAVTFLVRVKESLEDPERLVLDL